MGSEAQAEDLISYIRENARTEDGIWKTSIFGKSVEQLVGDGIRTRLAVIGEESQKKLQETMKRIVNESRGRLHLYYFVTRHQRILKSHDLAEKAPVMAFFREKTDIFLPYGEERRKRKT